MGSTQLQVSASLRGPRKTPIFQTYSTRFARTAAYNQRLQPTPAAFIQPQNASEVSSAIKCASDAGVPVSARSGGHSYASFAFGGVDQHVLTIDLANFKDITIDELNIAKVGSGNKLGDVALKLNEKNRGMPHGVCPWVGVGGHASYGGEPGI